MRELKFRAWDMTYNKMVYSYVAGLWKLFIAFDGVVGGYEDDDRYEDCAIYGGRFTHMQFIGLHDKNGKEIYEGDIIKDEHDRILLVEWLDCRFSFRALTRTNFIRANNIIEWFEGDTLRPEIVGNKYENPEFSEPPLSIQSHAQKRHIYRSHEAMSREIKIGRKNARKEKG